MVSVHDRVATYASPRVESYASTGETCPELCVKYDVDIREFVILACIHDTNEVDKDEICRLLGLSPTTVELCLERLSENGLIRFSDGALRLFRLTSDGIALIRKAAE